MDCIINHSWLSALCYYTSRIGTLSAVIYMSKIGSFHIKLTDFVGTKNINKYINIKTLIVSTLLRHFPVPAVSKLLHGPIHSPQTS